MSYQNVLAISHRGKGIPYGGFGEVREDGDANYGFVCLKGALEKLDDIPELARDDALKKLVAVINAPESSLFSVGCASTPVSNERGHRYTGYIEFAMNSKQDVAVAQSYFNSFFFFEQFLKNKEVERPIQYYWEIMPAHFLDTDTDGFSCSITVNTNFEATKEAADKFWVYALSLLTEFLPHVTSNRSDVIY